jgi:hypothetical protein
MLNILKILHYKQRKQNTYLKLNPKWAFYVYNSFLNFFWLRRKFYKFFYSVNKFKRKRAKIGKYPTRPWGVGKELVKLRRRYNKALFNNRDNYSKYINKSLNIKSTFSCSREYQSQFNGVCDFSKSYLVDSL